MRKEKQKFDFTPIGEAIKKERIRRKMSREQAAYLLQIESRYLTNIENKGQQPSLEVFSRLVALYNISVDQYFLPNQNMQYTATTERLHLNESLNNLSNDELVLLQYLVDGMIEQKNNHK